MQAFQQYYASAKRGSVDCSDEDTSDESNQSKDLHSSDQAFCMDEFGRVYPVENPLNYQQSNSQSEFIPSPSQPTQTNQLTLIIFMDIIICIINVICIVQTVLMNLTTLVIHIICIVQIVLMNLTTLIFHIICIINVICIVHKIFLTQIFQLHLIKHPIQLQVLTHSNLL